MNSTKVLLAAAFISLAAGMPSSSNAADGDNMLIGDFKLEIAKPEEEGKWTRIVAAGIPNSGYVGESWRWESEKDGVADFQLKAEYKRQSPPPPASEVARAFQRAASRASYANTISDEAIDDKQQWVEYSLPMHGEGGYKKIVTLKDGYVTLTLPNADNWAEAEDGPEMKTWKALVECLRGAKVVDNK